MGFPLSFGILHQPLQEFFWAALQLGEPWRSGTQNSTENPDRFSLDSTWECTPQPRSSRRPGRSGDPSASLFLLQQISQKEEGEPSGIPGWRREETLGGKTTDL